MTADPEIDARCASWPERVAADNRRIEQIPLPGTVPELLQRAARRYGHLVAVDFFEDGESLTYLDLCAKARALADGLNRLGVGKGTHVAVLLPTRIEYAVIWLGLAELGAVMVPIVFQSTPAEIEFVLRDSEADWLFIDDSVRAKLNSVIGSNSKVTMTRIIVVGAAAPIAHRTFEEIVASGSPEFQTANPPSPDDLLNIQYTSGTTGMPKGVMLSHRYWIIAGCVPALMWRDSIRTILSDHPFHYLDPQWMLMMGLYAGARVDFSRQMSARRFLGWLRRNRTELVWFAEPIVKFPFQETDRQHDVKLFLAYNFSREMVNTVQQRYGARVRELYGMTEIGPGLAVPLEVEDPDIIGSCGLPTPYRRCRIVDASGQDVVPGQVGELWVSGAGILQGYYKRPEANAQMLVGEWFRTGDLFVQDEKGYFRIVGRLKDMIKRSGENISALEVERALRDMPDILDAAVVPVPDDDRGEEVKACVLLRAGRTPQQVPPAAILEHCARTLSAFKLPRYIEYVDRFDYTSSDKIAKHLLIGTARDPRAGSYDRQYDVWR